MATSKRADAAGRAKSWVQGLSLPQKSQGLAGACGHYGRHIAARKEAQAWNPGYEPGLEKYLSDRTWEAPLPKARDAPACNAAAPTEYQKRKQEQRLMAQMLLQKETSDGNGTEEKTPGFADQGQSGLSERALHGAA